MQPLSFNGLIFPDKRTVINNLLSAAVERNKKWGAENKIGHSIPRPSTSTAYVLHYVCSHGNTWFCSCIHKGMMPLNVTDRIRFPRLAKTGGDSSTSGRKTNLFRESGDFAGNWETWEIFREIWDIFGTLSKDLIYMLSNNIYAQ